MLDNTFIFYDIFQFFLGLKACNATYACHKCEIKKEDFWQDNSRICQLVLRSTERSKYCLDPKNEVDDMSYERRPIFHFIEFSEVVFDTMHESVRIPNHMLKMTYHMCIVKDRKNSKDLNELPTQKDLFVFIQSTGIKNPYTIKSSEHKTTENNFILRAYTGEPSKKIAQLINPGALRGLKKAVMISQCFNDWFRIHKGYTHNFYRFKLDLLQDRLNSWRKLFNKIFPNKNFTVYMHNFCDHLVQYLKDFGDVDRYNIQG